MNSQNLIHIRRCHICGCVNEEAQSQVLKCNQCGKYFAPFVFFDENLIQDYAVHKNQLNQIKLDNDMTPKKSSKESILAECYPPLWGFTSYWSF